MSIPINEIVNVALLRTASTATRDNMNTVALFTSEIGKLNTANRTEIYTDLRSLELDFGTTSKTYEFAKSFFSQTPNPTNVGGYLVTAFWRAENETAPATSAILTSGQHTENALVSALQPIDDGEFNITVDGTPQVITGLDFSAVSTLAEIADVLDTAITGATVTVSNGYFKITSDTTGVTSTITYATDGAGGGTYVGDVLLLSTGSGAVATQGADSVVIPAESKQLALSEAEEKAFFKAFVFIDKPSDIEREELASYAQANELLSADVFDEAVNLERDKDTNVAWRIKLAEQKRYRMIYSKSGDRRLAVGMLSRLMTVDFNATATANTGHLKSIAGAIPEDFSATELDSAQKVGLDVYSTIKGTSILFTSGSNGYFDNEYNLLAYSNAIQVDTYNVLRSSPTKVAQTQRGVNLILDRLERTTQGFVNAGVFSPGTWLGAVPFGDVTTFKNSIETKGFYILPERLSDQSLEDRQNRVSPTFRIAVKNAGAFHQLLIVANFEE